MTRTRMLGFALAGTLFLGVLALGRATRADPPSLSPSNQAFVDTMEGFTTLQTAITVDPGVFGHQDRTLRGVLHLRNDGAMALDMALQVRVAFDGERFTRDRYGPEFDLFEFWEDKVTVTNAVFSAIRGGNATWQPYGPSYYGLDDPNLARNDWVELQLPGSQLSGHRAFFLMNGDKPSQLWIYDDEEIVRTVIFRSWVVDPPLPPQALSSEAPPLQVDQGYTHIPADGAL